MESSSVRAPLTAACIAESTAGVVTYRERALSAYHLPIAAHVVGDET